MTRILIAGSRSYNDYEEFRDIMNFICKDYNDIEIVSGGAHGADFLAEKYAKEYKLKLTIFKSQGDLYGKSAGYKRNIEMQNYISQSPSRLCVCFWDGESKGTKHNFNAAKERNTELIVYNFIKHKKEEI